MGSRNNVSADGNSVRWGGVGGWGGREGWGGWGRRERTANGVLPPPWLADPAGGDFPPARPLATMQVRMPYSPLYL